MDYFNRMAWVGAIAVSVILGACSSTPVTQQSASIVAPSSAASAKTTPASSQAATSAKASANPLPAYADPASLLSQKRSVYFDFDESVVKADYAALLAMHGKFLASHPNVKVTVQGNTDEQGGAEYNLALGQKRADAVTKALKIYGVKSGQMEAISFGKEKPKAAGHDEAAHQENRRADIVYPVK